MQVSASTPKPNLQSCQFCRKRKIRCDKLEGGCSQCARAQTECIYPASQRKGRPRKAGTARPAPPPTPREALLLKKIWRLERTIAELNGTGGAMAPLPAHIDSMDDDEAAETPRERLGRLVIGKSYVDDTFWSNQLKNVLEESDEDSTYDEEDGTPFSAAPTTSSGACQASFLFGANQASASLTFMHPPASQIRIYWNLYQENCEILLRMFHTPTTSRVIAQAEADINCLSRGNEVLMFSIYFATVTSMTVEEVSNTFGADRTALLTQYENAVRGALVNAGFLNSQDLAVLQGFVLYLICIRHNDGAAVWTMTGLALRIAHGMGLDRDGELFNLRPLEVELRRRLWHQISLLDLRSSEARGAFATFLSYDTKLPTNINECDISLETVNYPEPRSGLTDMTGALLRIEVCKTTRRLFRTTSLSAKEKLIQEFAQNVETNYIQYCEGGGPFHRWCAKQGNLVKERMILMIFKREENLPQGTRERLFFTSIQIIDLANQLRRDNYAHRWHWLVRTYMQWHAMAVVLSELAEQPRTEKTERAWTVIEETGPDWQIPEDSAGKILSQSVKKLLVKAQAHRQSQLGMSATISINNHLEDDEPPQRGQPVFFQQPPFNPTPLQENSPVPTQFTSISDPMQQQQQLSNPHQLHVEEMGQQNSFYDPFVYQGPQDHSVMVFNGQYWNGWDPVQDYSVHGGTT